MNLESDVILKFKTAEEKEYFNVIIEVRDDINETINLKYVGYSEIDSLLKMIKNKLDLVIATKYFTKGE